MNIKNRIKKISDAMKTQSENEPGKPFLTLEQWKRHASGEDITAEIPEHRRAEFDEWERIADERINRVEELYFKRNPDMREEVNQHLAQVLEMRAKHEGI